MNKLVVPVVIVASGMIAGRRVVAASSSARIGFPGEALLPDAARRRCKAMKRLGLSAFLVAASIVGTDEVDLDRNHISWVSPLGRALLKSAAGDTVVLQAPGGTESLDVLEVRYERVAVEPFREPLGSESSSKGSSRRSHSN